MKNEFNDPRVELIKTGIYVIGALILATALYFIIRKAIKEHKPAEGLKGDVSNTDLHDIVKDGKILEKETTILDRKTNKLNSKGDAILKTLLKELFAATYTSDDKVKAAITQLKTIKDFQIMSYWFDNMSRAFYNGEALNVRLAGEMFDSNYKQVLNYINSLPKYIK